jgi:Periplasmic protein involved in polysaccharide export
MVSLRDTAMLGAILLAGGCATLPTSGPTGQEIQRGASDPRNAVNFKIIELASFDALPSAPSQPAVFKPDFEPPPTDLIGPNDQLDISIYEVGITLFGGNAPVELGTGAGGLETSSRAEKLAVRVNDQGYIVLPYVGQVKAAGLRSSELANTIRHAYKGMSQDPQVLVALRDVIRNSVIVGGEISRPGRLRLQTNRETLSEVIALAGGYRSDAKDITVRVERLGAETEFRLSDVLSGQLTDMPVYPGDKISLVRAPRSFSVLGAAGRVEQISFSGPTVSLAEALATSGGANPNAGDAKAIFVFRFVKTGDEPEKPVVYHLNMMNPGGYLLSQRFAMRDKDVIYVGNAAANQPSKLIQLISQLFAPVVTVTSVVQTTGR